MSKKRGLSSISPPVIYGDRLESFAGPKVLLRFISRTYDGLYLLFLSVVYLFWAAYLLVIPEDKSGSYWPVIGVYPILMFVVYVRHRIGTSASDNKPIWFSLISLTAFAVVPIYIIFWR